MEREGTVCGRRTIVMKENELAEMVSAYVQFYKVHKKTITSTFTVV